MPATEKKDLNILVKGLSGRANRILDTLATLRIHPKHQVIRDALEEYADRHKDEIPRLAEVLADLPEEPKKRKRA